MRTAPGRLLAGIAARDRAQAGPLALVPCDNLPDNGEVVGRILHSMAELVGTDLVTWVEESVSMVATVIDRITPRTQPEDVSAVTEATGMADRAPVVAEPFAEWVLSGSFPRGRPRWEDAGATFTDDIAPFEQRKLWLLNGAHSLLAYAGSARGHATVAAAIADDTCTGWVEQWWDEASRHVQLPVADVAAYRAALVDRFTNPRISHRLEQIAADGTQKLPVRILPILARERAAGRVPSGATLALGAWVWYVRSLGSALHDPLAEMIAPLAAGRLPDAVKRLLDALDPVVGADEAIVAAVQSHAEHLGH